MTEDMTQPVFESAARLVWKRQFTGLVFYPDAPSVVFSFTPVFPGCADDLAAKGIVWDVQVLLDSVRQPGDYFLLNCECGYPPDADIEERVSVSHPDARSIVWELDCRGLVPALDEALRRDEGFVRLIFDREEYESDVRNLLCMLQSTARTSVPFAALSSLEHADDLEKAYPHLSGANADEFKPDHKGADIERFLAMDAEAPWRREPIFPPVTLFEIGPFGHDSYRIDGQPSRTWIGRWFTRWQALDAWRQWVACMVAAQDPDQRQLIGNRRREEGQRFAETLQACFGEGMTAPGVTVRYAG